MTFEISLTTRAIVDLQQLPPEISKRILTKLYFYSQQKNPLSFAKRLKNSTFGQFRFRIGDYRAIFDVNRKDMITILLILRVKHRKEAYD